MRLSGLQKDVLILYRSLLKSALNKQQPMTSWKERFSTHLFQLGL